MTHGATLQRALHCPCVCVQSVLSKLLEACGRVKSWNQILDPDTHKPKGFGFCEFEDAEGVIRALRLLNNLKLDGQELFLKVNTATEKYIEYYQQQEAAKKAERAEKAPEAEEAAAAATEGRPWMGKAGCVGQPARDLGSSS